MFWLGLAAALVLSILASVTSQRSDVRPTTALAAAIQRNGEQLVIANAGTDLWSDVVITVNQTFSKPLGTLHPNATASIGLLDLVASNGKRFDLGPEAVLTVEVDATLPNGWAGRYSTVLPR